MSFCFVYTVHRAKWVTVQELNNGRVTEASILLSHKLLISLTFLITFSSSAKSWPLQGAVSLT